MSIIHRNIPNKKPRTAFCAKRRGLPTAIDSICFGGPDVRKLRGEIGYCQSFEAKARRAAHPCRWRKPPDWWPPCEKPGGRHIEGLQLCRPPGFNTNDCPIPVAYANRQKYVALWALSARKLSEFGHAKSAKIPSSNRNQKCLSRERCAQRSD